MTNETGNPPIAPPGTNFCVNCHYVKPITSTEGTVHFCGFDPELNYVTGEPIYRRCYLVRGTSKSCPHYEPKD